MATITTGSSVFFLCALLSLPSLLGTLAAAAAAGEQYLERTVYAQTGSVSAPNRTEVATVSVNPPTWFGSVHMRDRSIADSPGADAAVVGRVMDASFKVVDSTEHTFYTYMILAFNDATSRFGGSTIQVGGLNRAGEAEWAILGGTGNFTMARGVVRRAWSSMPGLRKERLRIHAYYTPMPRAAEVPESELDANL